MDLLQEKQKKMRQRRPGKSDEETIENFAAKDTSIIMEDTSQNMNDS